MTDPITRLNAALEGRYEIERELGQGGMATVYLADDIKHERKVALKVLKPELAAVVGAERFLAEIKTTANLQHPHILPLFDSGEADTFLFYVMPYVEGESLRERLDREHQLPVDEAVAIATKVAGALQAAHERGVIHRDIKPANILLSKGEPLVSDFGIALAVGAAGGGRLTETGLSLGTPHYMSPEQATGDLSVGAATDVYALGCVLYEMLVGEPPYTGKTAQAILGKIVTGDADPVSEHRRAAPPNVDAAIRRALEKLPADRFTVAQDFAKALGDAGFRYGEGAAAVAATGAGPWNRLAMATTALAVLFGGGLLWSLSRATSDTSPGPVVRFTVPVGEDAELYLGSGEANAYGRPSFSSLAFSPAGDLLAYAGWEQSSEGAVLTGLYRRWLDQERVDLIEGTEGALAPFFSPDGAWLGFFSVEGDLRRVSVEQGDVETVVPGAASGPFGAGPLTGATWGDDGTIVWTDGSSLYRVLAGGGEPELLLLGDTTVSRRVDRQFAHPHMLPGGRSVLVTDFPVDYVPDRAEVFALHVETGRRTPLLTNATDARYVETGHLLFMRQGSLMAVGFDPERLEVLGQPVIVLDDVMQAVMTPAGPLETYAAQLAISSAGHLAYASGGIYPNTPVPLVRVSPDGEETPLEADPTGTPWPRVSPEGDRVVFARSVGPTSTLHVHDRARRVTWPLNVRGRSNNWPAWSPDGSWIALSSNREDSVPNIYRMAADGSGEPVRLAPSDQPQRMMSWSSQGVIAYTQDDDIWMLPPDGEAAPFFRSDESEHGATFSPDGRWVAYHSGQQVYVRPYPGPEPATRVSDGRSINPAWSRDGRRLFFVQQINARENQLMVADVVSGEELTFSDPVPFITPWPYEFQFFTRNYDVLPDGSFVATRGVGDLRVEEFHVVLNFSEELKTRVPVE